MIVLHKTKSLKPGNINKFYLLVSEEGMFQIASLYSVPMLPYRSIPTINFFSARYKIIQALNCPKLCSCMSDELMY